ncbi:uncharacterized protein TNCV_4220741 [Trichonephila clavipes]|nr:uncharacterized protein TNCV_4220741 [Trichonephila clavipes]
MFTGHEPNRACLEHPRQAALTVRPVDPRDVIYTKTRHKTPFKDKSSRRPPHRKKCTRTANCFIGCHPGTGSSFTGALCLLEPYESDLLKDIGVAAPITCDTLDAHPSTPSFETVPRTRKLNCSGMEPGRL